MITPAEIIHAAAIELMGDYGKATYEDVIRAAHDRIYGAIPPVVSGFSTVAEYAADVELIAGLVEARHYRTGDEWPADYAATLMVATFGPPPPHGYTHDDVRQAVDAGEGAFWEAVAQAFPGITTGDLDPGASQALTDAMRAAVAAWVEANAPTLDEIEGSHREGLRQLDDVADGIA